ncbi:MAG: hypothetical protein AB7E81_08135 [Hyphomicrobiaceae bacterium]
MYGGLLKTASAVAMLAAAGLFANANAADFGGDCCADLEERVAELESSTVRKGNRKVSLSISGFVGAQAMWWDDGTQTDTYFNDDGNNTSRFRFLGTAKISPAMTAGFTYEFSGTMAGSQGQNQGNSGDDLGASGMLAGAVGGPCGSVSSGGCVILRDATVWLRHKQLGMVKIGKGSTATDNLILIDLGNKGVSSTPDAALHNGRFFLRGNNGVFGGATWDAAIRGSESFDTDRRKHVLYETPTLVGFTLQAAVAEDNFWDVALRYAGEFGGFRLAAGIGYQENSEFNRPDIGIGVGDTSVTCLNNCDVKATDLKGSASILHVPTGLFVTGAAGKRELDGQAIAGDPTSSYVGPDITWWYLSGGISQNFFGVGKTVLYGEYLNSQGGLEQSAFVTANANYVNNDAFAGSSSSEAQMWGVGLTQHIDAAAMELYVSYKNYSLDANGFTGVTTSLNSGAGGVADFQTVIVGTRINF